MRFTASILFVLPGLVLGAPAGPASSGGVAPIKITPLTVSGSGCSGKSFSTSISDDGTVLTLGFDQYQTLVGPGVSGSDREKNCDILLSLRYPLGCTSGVINTTYHGFAQLSQGVSGNFPATYAVSPGSASGNPSPTTFSASGFAAGGVYTKKDLVAAKENIKVANQQDVRLAVGTRIMMQAANAAVSGTLTVDDMTISITKLQRC